MSVISHNVGVYLTSRRTHKQFDHPVSAACRPIASSLLSLPFYTPRFRAPAVLPYFSRVSVAIRHTFGEPDVKRQQRSQR